MRATSAMTGAPRSGVSAHLTPTKKRRRTLAGKLTNHLKQGRCRMCSKKSQYTCSLCLDLDMHDDTKEVFLCHSKTGRACFAEHIENVHLQCQHSLNVEDLLLGSVFFDLRHCRGCFLMLLVHWYTPSRYVIGP